MKKLLVIGLVAGLLLGALGPVDAAKRRRKPKPVAMDQKFFLHDNSCDEENTLSLLDGPDNSCWYIDSGILYDVFEGAGLLAVEDLAQSWGAIDGVPLTLDATKPITGEITTASGSCLLTGAPCSPAGIGAGQATLDVIVLGEIDGEEKEVGTFTEDYVIAPGQKHTSKIEIKVDEALDKVQMGALRVLTYLHGAAVGHGLIELEDPASFITVPAWVAP